MPANLRWSGPWTVSGCGASARVIVHSRRRLDRVGRLLSLDVKHSQKEGRRAF